MASSSSSSSASLHRLRDLTEGYSSYSNDDDLDDGVVERGGGHHHVPITSNGGGGYTDHRDDGPSYRSGFRPWNRHLSMPDTAAPPGPAGAALPPPSSPTHSRGSSEKTLSDDDGRHQAPSSAPPHHHHHQQQLELPPHVAQPQREFICAECGKSYPTNQGLGGHVAGHSNKRREAAAAAARAAGEQEDGGGGEAHSRGERKEGPHVCSDCGKEFERGVQLGGHKRAHYTGPPIKPARRNNKRRGGLAPPPPGVAVGEDNVNVVAAPPPPVIGSEEEETPSPPAAANVRPVRLFGIDIGRLSRHTQMQVVEPSSEQQDSRPAPTADRG